MWYDVEKAYSIAKNRVMRSNKISKKDKTAINKLLNKLLASTKIKKRRAIKYYDNLRLMLERNNVPTYHDLTEEHLDSCLSEIEQNPAFGPLTKRDYKIALKRMLEFLENPLASQIKTSAGHYTIPEFFVSIHDVLKMIRTDRPLRDRIMAACFYESNCRPHEFFQLKKENLRFETILTKAWDGNGGMVEIRIEVCFLGISPESKTGPRNPPLIFTVPLLKMWLATINNSEYVWTGIGNPGRDEVIEYPAAAKAIRELARAANILNWKKVTLYKFRHGMNTYLSGVLTQAQQNEHAGWKQGSKMAATYIHMKGTNLLKPLLAPFGIMVISNQDEREAWLELMRIGVQLAAEPKPKSI
jgi:integrase